MSDLSGLFRLVHDTTAPSFKDNAWYLITAASLVACGKPECLSELYLYHTKECSVEQKRDISTRLGDMLMKEWTLVGIPLIITAVAALAKAEGIGNERVLELERPIPHLNPITSARGTEFIQALYKQNLQPIFSTWGSHTSSFEWLEKSIIYGLFLSDHSVLSAVETEIVILASIMCQGLRAPTLWHLRGLRRLGVSAEEVETVQEGVEAVARWAGRGTEGWARVADVEGEV